MKRNLHRMTMAALLALTLPVEAQFGSNDARKIRGTNVDAPTSGDDGKALVYDFTNNKFKLAAASGGSTASVACPGNPYAASSTSVSCTHSIGSGVHQITCEAASGGGLAIPSSVTKGAATDTLSFAGGLLSGTNCFVTGSLGVAASCSGNPYSATATATCTHSLSNVIHTITCETASGGSPVLYSSLTKGSNADTIAWTGTLIAATNCFAR